MWESELEFANELADRASEIGLHFFGGEFEIDRKPDHTPVTEADLAIEAAIRKALAERFPDDAVWGEEHGLDGDADRVWVVDPIDGTKNFANEIQIWATLIGLSVEGQPKVGVVSAPALGERYMASRGSGAYLNGESINVSDEDLLRRAFLAHGGLGDWLRFDMRERFLGLAGGVRRTRGVGDFWGHMLVARGAADIMVELELRVWDTTAVQVVVEEAGGRMTALDGSPLRDHSGGLSTNGLLHDEVAALFA